MCARCTPTCGCRATRGRFPVPDIGTSLTDYRDAIRYVYDQTIRQINQGRTPDEIAATLKLPAHLAASPYLQAFYGNVPWSVRAIYGGLLGWYDGDSATLQPLAPDDTARHMVALAGGIDAIARQIGRASCRERVCQSG